MRIRHPYRLPCTNSELGAGVPQGGLVETHAVNQFFTQYKGFIINISIFKKILIFPLLPLHFFEF